MIRSIQRTSGICFYVLAGTCFLAYLLHVNEIGSLALWWLNIADLPLLLVGCIYGGVSLYLSVKPRQQESKTLLLIIGVPLLLIFLVLVTMNFWPAF